MLVMARRVQKEFVAYNGMRATAGKSVWAISAENLVTKAPALQALSGPRGCGALQEASTR